MPVPLLWVAAGAAGMWAFGNVAEEVAKPVKWAALAGAAYVAWKALK
ncbi:hypothetical protein ABIE65_005033 [Constrictibacter sp. MBR-5]|jgi:hypothetical protein